VTKVLTRRRLETPWAHIQLSRRPPEGHDVKLSDERRLLVELRTWLAGNPRPRGMSAVVALQRAAGGGDVTARRVLGWTAGVDACPPEGAN
jgi:hypothetical protein